MTTRKTDVRAAWLAEIRECDKRRDSLIRRIKRASRAGDHRKAAELDQQYWETLAPALRPEDGVVSLPLPVLITSAVGDRDRESRMEPTHYVNVITNSYGRLSGLLYAGEWDKTIPQRLRNEKGREAWETLAIWGMASEAEKRNLKEVLSRLWIRSNAADALRKILRALEREDSGFFSKLGLALEEKRLRAFQKVKEDLIGYRISLDFSRTPGETRHTISEIAQIVSPNIVKPENSKNMAVFRNMVREFKVPHLSGKRGKGSPNYGKCAGR